MASILFHTVVLPVEMRSKPSMITNPDGTNYYITFSNGAGDHHDAMPINWCSKAVVEITVESNVEYKCDSVFTRIGGTNADAKCNA